jgi:hypothetical protein
MALWFFFLQVYKNMYMNKITKERKKERTDYHHRVINSSTGGVVEDDGINVEIAIVTGTFDAIVDAEDKNDDESGIDDIDDDKSLLLIIIPRKES